MSNQDIIFINGLTIPAIIGVYEWERSIKQKIILDIEIFTDISDSAKDDNISATIDYKLLADSIYEFVSSSNFKLIETLADNIVALIFRDTNASKLKLKLSKPKAIAFADNVGVIIERIRK